MTDTLVERLEARRVGLAILDAHGQFEIENKSYGSPVVWGEAHTTLLGSAAILAMKDRLDEAAARIRELEAHGAWWKTVIGEGAEHKPSGEIRSIKHMHPLMVKPFYDAHKGDAIGDIIAGLIFNLEITQNRETFLVADANERRKAAEDALEDHIKAAPPEPNTPAQDGGPDHG